MFLSEPRALSLFERSFVPREKFFISRSAPNSFVRVREAAFSAFCEHDDFFACLPPAKEPFPFLDSESFFERLFLNISSLSDERRFFCLSAFPDERRFFCLSAFSGGLKRPPFPARSARNYSFPSSEQ